MPVTRAGRARSFATVVLPYVFLAVAMVVGFLLIQRESHARTVAVCQAVNETRAQVRKLARDLTHNPETLAKVDLRFAPKDCGDLSPGSSTSTRPGGPG